MFSNKSTDDLLATIEDELTEIIELSSPRRIFKEKFEIEKQVEIEKETENQKESCIVKETMPPVPAKRNLSNLVPHENPVPVERKTQLRGKNEKNDENEIIQLSSMSSSSVSENHRNVSQNMVVVASADRTRLFENDIVEIHETESIAEEEFFVLKQGKWGERIAETEIDDPPYLPAAKVSDQKPHLEIVSEKPTKKSSKRHEGTSASSSTKTSNDSSSESSSESSAAKKKSKKRKRNDKKKSKKKQNTDDQESSTGTSSKDEKAKLISNQAIGEKSSEEKL